MVSVKQDSLETIKQLSAEAEYEDIMYALYVRKKIAEGEKSFEIGQFISQEEIEREFLNL